MGLIITINDHLDVELRRESFCIHDDESPADLPSPEFGYERVFPLKAALGAIEKEPRFVEWLQKREGRIAAHGRKA